MPIFSYIAVAKNGSKQALCDELTSLNYCEIIPSVNDDVIVLITDTPNSSAEEALQKNLKNLQSLQSLSLAFGYDEKEK